MSAGLIDALVVQRRVLGALVLRDMRTRFGRSFMGYVIIVGWPLTHLLGLMSLYLVTRRVAPVGASVPIFLATGVLPYILCLYPARMIMVSLSANLPLLQFPVVKATDVVLARGILEILTAFWVTLIFAIILFICGVDIVPIHYQEAIQAILATIYLGFAFGFISALLYKLARAYIIVQVLTMIAMYTSPIRAALFFRNRFHASDHSPRDAALPPSASGWVPPASITACVMSLPSPSRASLARPDARIDEAIGDIHHQVAHHDDEGIKHRDPHDHRVVARGDAVDEEPAIGVLLAVGLIEEDTADRRAED